MKEEQRSLDILTQSLQENNKKDKGREFNRREESVLLKEEKRKNLDKQ